MRDSVIGGRSKRNDTNIKQLAKDFDMTNIKSTKEGEAQDGYLTRKNAPPPEMPPEQAPGNGVMWGDAGKFSMAGMLGGMIKSVRGEPVGFSPKDANLPSKLPTVVHANDPSLKIDRS
jgi:hypothetical protein